MPFNNASGGQNVVPGIYIRSRDGDHFLHVLEANGRGIVCSANEIAHNGFLLWISVTLVSHVYILQGYLFTMKLIRARWASSIVFLNSIQRNCQPILMLMLNV